MWPSFAKQLESAGADALELNIYSLPIDFDSPGTVYEDRHLQTLKEVKKAVSIPVSIKLTSQITSIPFLAKRLSDAECDGLVLFNWFVEPDIDVRTLKTRSSKGKGNFRQSLRWVALLSGRISCDIASSGGAQSGEDVVKMVLAGASAVQVCSVLYAKGIDEIGHLLRGLEIWMDEQKYSRIEDFKGELSYRRQELSFKGLGEADAYFRAQYLKVYAKSD